MRRAAAVLHLMSIVGLLPMAAGAQPDAAPGGRAIVHGVLVAQWLPDPQRPRAAGARVASVVLLPGAESTAQLARHTGRTLAGIDMEDGMQALRMAAGTAIADSFARRGVATVQAEGVFALEQLVVDPACARGARARLLEADPINVRTGLAPTPLPCRRD